MAMLLTLSQQQETPVRESFVKSSTNRNSTGSQAQTRWTALKNLVFIREDLSWLDDTFGFRHGELCLECTHSQLLFVRSQLAPHQNIPGVSFKPGLEGKARCQM